MGRNNKNKHRTQMERLGYSSKIPTGVRLGTINAVQKVNPQAAESMTRKLVMDIAKKSDKNNTKQEINTLVDAIKDGLDNLEG